jgi:hypothetical protein
VDAHGVFFTEGKAKAACSASVIASDTVRPDVFTRVRASGNLVEPAYCYLQSVLNKKLDQHRVTGRLLWDSTGKGLTVHIVPETLIGCLWLQFAKAIEGKDYRQCENCKLWFECGGTRGARSDKRFCSPTCKAALHRKEHDRALVLRTQGWTAVKIAKELGKDIKTVKGWIAK